MSKLIESSFSVNSNSVLYETLKNCANLQSYEDLPFEDYNICIPIFDIYKMISTKSYSTSGNISSSSFASDESFGDSILEKHGRISLAYENLNTIPRNIAEKFSSQTKFLDLSYNNFSNLSFLSFFEELHTLILDRNNRLETNTFPYLPNLKILWLNNCNISNITEWITRIQMQCPELKQLSIMGNPGVKSSINYFTQTTLTITSMPLPVYVCTSFLEYILYMLPKLEYLDGISTASKDNIETLKPNKYAKEKNSSLSFTSNSSSINYSKIESDKSLEKQSKVLSLDNFKNFFRFKRRKYINNTSSSTN